MEPLLWSLEGKLPELLCCSKPAHHGFWSEWLQEGYQVNQIAALCACLSLKPLPAHLGTWVGPMYTALGTSLNTSEVRVLPLPVSPPAHRPAQPSVCHVYDICSFQEPQLPAVFFTWSHVFSEVLLAQPEVLLSKIYPFL